MNQAALDLLMMRLHAARSLKAIVWHDESFDYGWLLDRIEKAHQWLIEHQVEPGTVIFLAGDYSPETIAMLLALWKRQAIAVPFSQTSSTQRHAFLDISQAECILRIENERPSLLPQGHRSSHPLYEALRREKHAGLVLFSSGTSGPSKGIVHDVERFLAKLKRIHPRHQRTLAFLILDHLGGLDTLLYTLANCGCLVIPSERTPDGILKAIEKHRVEVLPASPSFLNLVLISGAWQRHDLSSLQKISYGSEPMPETVLTRYHELLPHVKLTQTYGVSELGVMRSASKASDSLWMQLGGEGYETRIVDGVLQVRSPYMMLGYLNAPHPLTADGWYVTGDLVDTSEAYMRIKGRASDIINVGGEKVNPLEVEEVIRQIKAVADVLVFAEANPILGQIVCARIVPKDRSQEATLPKLVREHCLAHLPKVKVPVKIAVTYDDLSGARHKRKRTTAS